MKTKHFISVLLATAVILTHVSVVEPRAASKDCKYFKETGHYVCEQFLRYFRVKGGLEVFGFPLTEAFTDPTHGNLTVQYFQRARMEIHPASGGDQILLGLLIDEMGYTFPAAGPDQIPDANSSVHHYFPETQHVVSHAFLEAFRNKGGLEIFGYPRSEFFFEEGAVVQYFQRQRMEWYPDRPTGSQIQLTNVGEAYLESFDIPGNFDQPEPPPGRSRAGDRFNPTRESVGGSCRYFAETGHYVCEQFLEYFRAKGEIEIFGYPLTEAFDDPAHGGLYVQYFQNARMELHPDPENGYQVLLGLLVDELEYAFPPATPDQIPASNSATHHYFAETQHVVSYAFLDAFRDKGGLEIFGYPRSEFMYEDGRIVQYFQRGRMEWHPKNNPDNLIRLTNVGETYLERFEVPAPYQQPLKPGGLGTDNAQSSQSSDASAVIALQVSASVWRAIIGPDSHQTVYVHVTSQQEQPVEGASVAAMVHYPGRTQGLEFPVTSNRGFTKVTFEPFPSPPGQNVVVEVTALYQGLTDSTETSFQRWH